jgi:3'(2'), 5'-bisphosphate nucleotidase
MPLTDPDDHRLASELAAEAGALLVELRSELSARGADATTLKDEGDRRAHDFLMSALAEHRPADAVLSEEATDAERTTLAAQRGSSERVWIVDPLDGTREFAEVPRSDWAVHVALAVGGHPLVGAVALPALGTTITTVAPPALAESAHVPPRVIVSRSRPPAEALAIAEALGAELVEMGSAGAKAMAVVRGEVDVYPHSGGQYEWDSCAPVAVALASGLHCSRLDGSPLIYNRDDPYLPDLLICRPEFAAQAIDAARGD